jgi:hypothetical protein
LTLAAVAANKGIELGGLEARVTPVAGERRNDRDGFRVELSIGGSLTKRERLILENSARSCEIAKILSGHNTIHYQVRFKEESADR